ncbi:MAG: hypothetical protein MZW92_15025 [Comamonadaceae bacterium]|nr:hypothetical protein [Comamonadaceae bacterium]
MADTDDDVLQLTGRAGEARHGQGLRSAGRRRYPAQQGQADLLERGGQGTDRPAERTNWRGRDPRCSDALARDPGADGQEVIHRCICDIDEHCRTHHWPSAIAEDDPVLLKELWHRQQNRIVAARQLPEDGTRAARIAGLASEGNRILRTLLGLPATVSAQGEAEPVTTRDLVAALQTGSGQARRQGRRRRTRGALSHGIRLPCRRLWMPDYRQTQPHNRIEADEQPGILPIPDPESPGIDGADREPRHRPRRTGASSVSAA